MPIRTGKTAAAPPPTDTNGGSPIAGDAPFAERVHDRDDIRDRNEMIAEAAYFKAEKRGFGLGEEELDWLEAEQELIGALGEDHAPDAS